MIIAGIITIAILGGMFICREDVPPEEPTYTKQTLMEALKERGWLDE